MKILLFAAVLMLGACTMDVKTNQQISNSIKQELKAQSVSIADGAEANLGGFNGTKKEITISYTTGAPSGKLQLLNVAYRSAVIAFKLAQAAKDKMPDIFRIIIKSGTSVAATLDYKSAYLPQSKQYEQQVLRFLELLKAKQYQNLPALVEPDLNLSSIVSIFRQADATIGGVQAYRLLALQHTRGVSTADSSKVDIIQVWAGIRGNTAASQGVMMFVFRPGSAIIRALYVNPRETN